MKIVLVGSMQFHEEYKAIKEKLEKKKHTVLIPLPNDHYQKFENIKRKAMQDFSNNLNKSDAILVANFDKKDKPDYIGVNSLMEIGMAFNKNKKIFLLNNLPKGMEDELEAIGTIILRGNLDKLK